MKWKFEHLSSKQTTNHNIEYISNLTTNDELAEHYSNDILNVGELFENKQTLHLSLIPEEVIDFVMLLFMNPKVLHYLKCINSNWKTKIESFLERLVPKFEFKSKFGSEGSGKE
jgi:hypothetical protein